MEIILGQEGEKPKEQFGNNLNDFEILQTLGKGSYGFVAKVKSKINKKIYAMKMIDFSTIKDPAEKQLSFNEIEILTKLDSPHIVKCYHFFNNGDKYYILMEYMDNGDLKGYINAHQNMKTPINEDELVQIFYQCMSGLSYVHQNKLIHRDIKPANIFLTNDKVYKIGDFGVSAIRKPIQNNSSTPTTPITPTNNMEKESIMIGTPLYMSPEIFKQEPYGSKVDIYSMGCTFFELCHYTPPRIPTPIPKNVNGKLEIITDFKDVDENKKENAGFYSPEIETIINNMIKINQKERPSTEEIFKSIKDLYNKRFKQNSSIFCVCKCLFTFQNFVNSITKHGSKNNNNLVISNILFYAINNKNTLNYCLQDIRDVLVYENPCFFDPGEIEPNDLLDFILKRLHIENNHIKNQYSRLFCRDNDNAIFQREEMLKKYLLNFGNYFKSFISDKFFGHFEITKKCSSCNKIRYYFESFFYLTIDVSEAIKSGLNLNDNNFIYNCFQKQFYNINKVSYCPSCKMETNHLENKKIFAFPINLIICIKYNEGQMNNQNIIYPINLLFPNIASFLLTGLIKRQICDETKYFVSIYSDSNTWTVNDGFQSFIIQTPLIHPNGQVVMLFYNSNNNQ